MAYFDFVYRGDPYRGSSAAYYVDYDPVTTVNLQAQQALTDYMLASVRLQNLTNVQDGAFLNYSWSKGREVLLSLQVTY